MSNSNEKPIHLRARMNRAGAKAAGALTVFFGIAFVTSLNIVNIIGGVVIIYAGLIAFPATRVFVSRGRLGFTKWRAYGARLLWLFLCIIGLFITYMG